MLNFGIISTARINREAIFLPVANRDDVFVKAVASRNIDKAESYSKIWGVPSFYGSYAELLEDPAIDAVYISTPNALHVTYVKQALLKNKHVLCEKPFSPTYSEAFDLVNLAKSRGLLLMEAMHYACHPGVYQIINDLQDGKLGEIESIFVNLGINTPVEGDIRYRLDLMGGSFMHLGCYCLHFIQNTTNLSLKLDNIYVERKNEQSADILSVGNVQSETGLKFFFKTTFQEQLLNSFVKIQGTKGSMTIDSIFNPVSQQGDKFVDIIKVHSDVFNVDHLVSDACQSTYASQLDVFVTSIKKGNLSPLVDCRYAALMEQGRKLLESSRVRTLPEIETLPS